MGAAQGLCLAPVKGLAGGMSAALSGLWGGDGLAQAVGVRDAARCWGWVRDGVRGAARTGRAAALGTSRHLMRGRAVRRSLRAAFVLRIPVLPEPLQPEKPHGPGRGGSAA